MVEILNLLIFHLEFKLKFWVCFFCINTTWVFIWGWDNDLQSFYVCELFQIYSLLKYIFSFNHKMFNIRENLWQLDYLIIFNYNCIIIQILQVFIWWINVSVWIILIRAFRIIVVTMIAVEKRSLILLMLWDFKPFNILEKVNYLLYFLWVILKVFFCIRFFIVWRRVRRTFIVVICGTLRLWLSWFKIIWVVFATLFIFLYSFYFFIINFFLFVFVFIFFIFTGVLIIIIFVVSVFKSSNLYINCFNETTILIWFEKSTKVINLYFGLNENHKFYLFIILNG